MKKSIQQALSLKKYRDNPQSKPCDCGRRAAVYRAGAFMCARCAELDTADRRRVMVYASIVADARMKPEQNEIVETKVEEKWLRARGEEPERVSIGWGSLEILERMLKGQPA